MPNLLYSCIANKIHVSDKLAICEADGAKLSYEQFCTETNALANLLQKAFLANAKNIIAVDMPKSALYVQVIFAIHQLNQCFLPIPFDNPQERKQQILDNAMPHFLISAFTQNGYDIKDTLTENYYLLERKKTAPQNIKTDTAFILFTSGSTGVPKGVCISYQAVFAFVSWAKNQFNLNENDVVPSIAPFHFDLSTFDLYATFLAGATLLIPSLAMDKNPRMMVPFLAESKISVIYATPSFLQMMMDFGKLEKYDFSNLRQILFAGEVFPFQALNRFRQILPEAGYANLYGPTETNVSVYYELNNALLTENLPIGNCTPFCNYIIENEELLISGESLFSHYINNEEASDEKFIWIEGVKHYKTGDKINIENNLLYYTGRIDRMIKRRGYRIELAEIERASQTLEGIKQSAAVVKNQKVSVFMVGNERNVPRLKQELLEILPDYMLPDNFVFLENLPLTSSGKIDYQKLESSLP